MVQTVLVINFAETATEDQRQEIVNKFYLNNEKAIAGMTAAELNPGVDKSKEISEVLK